MTIPLQHTFELRKTQFIAQKDNCDPDGVSLQLLQSTCLLTEPLNRNNVLQGNNLIYLNGAYLTFYNFFQNNKQFGSLVSPNKPVGMVGSSTGKGCVAIVTQNQTQSQLQISIYTYCQDYVPTHVIKRPLRFIDIVMIRSSYIILAVEDLKTKEGYVYIFNSKTVYPINFYKKHQIKRLICQDHRIYVVFQEYGLLTLDTQKPINKEEDIIQYLEYRDMKVDDYCEIDNQTKIVLYNGFMLNCYWFQTEKQYTLDFKNYVDNCKGHRLIKIGRNILVAHRNSLTISHFIIGDDVLNFVGNHVYSEKLKAGIVSVQSSQDEMHAAFAVEIIDRQQTKIQNFIFNLSSISKSHKFISPFTRVMAMGAECGTFNTMENVLSSNAYLLIGSKIFNLFYSTTLERKKMFNLYEVPKFMTVHPLGYQFLCGFDNMIKFYNKVQKDMEQIWSEQYICTAAKYSKSGNLVLSCIEDSFTVLVLYDCYNFRRLHNIPIYYLKMYATKIEWVHNNSAVVLYTNNEMMKINIFSGQKISQFKQNKEKNSIYTYSIKCIQYDTFCDKIISGTNVSTLVIASKNQNNGHSLNNVKVVNFYEDVACIKINHGLKSIFFGGKSGILYWCSYPLKIKNAINQEEAQSQQPGQSIQAGAFAICQDVNQLKLHNATITSIDFTSNNKFMLVNIKSQGYFKCRVRKLRTKQISGSINVNAVFQQLGNPILNTIDVSSSSAYTMNKQKLKIALQKRKQCFNDLQEFRRQWDFRLALTSKQIEITSKKDQLNFINQTLNSIQEVKQKKKHIQTNIDDIIKQTEDQKTQQQQKYIKQMLQLYEESDKQLQILQNKKRQYNNEYQKLVKDCDENLIQIDKDLNEKRLQFQKNYQQMLNNLKKFKQRHLFEKQQESEQRKLQIKQYLKNLEMHQIQLNKLTNDLSVKMTQSKKQYQRYCNRRAFLEHKNRFFEQENYNCKQQKKHLQQLKEKLQKQLKQLQFYTDKKQKKLKIYLQANQSLRKYKQIHQNMTENARRQTQFIKSQKLKVDDNIVEIQKQLSMVASSNQQADKQIAYLQNQIQKFKKKNYDLSLKYRDVGFYLSQILAAMENVGFCKDENLKSQKLKQIYKHFYVQRSVQALIQKQNRNQLGKNQNLTNQRNQKIKIQQTKILNQLNDQKQYLMNNIQMFKNYNKRVNQQINLNFLQIQSQNYNLIAQCNLRKQQTSNKKKMLHELIDSVKETQIYLDQMKKQGSQNSLGIKKGRKTLKTTNQIPFLLYERSKQEKSELQRVKSSQQSSLTCSRSNFQPNGFIHSNTNFRPTTTHKNFDQSSKYHIKKMFDIKGYCALPEQKIQFRRIQTAKSKKKLATQEPIDRENHGIIKPLTATFKRRHQRQTLKSAFSIKNKSSSKPSTCATYSRGKPSVAI